MAFLTLFRIATGDNWNGIMKVCNLIKKRIHLKLEKIYLKGCFTSR
jgi:hypothetical protein